MVGNPLSSTDGGGIEGEGEGAGRAGGGRSAPRAFSSWICTEIAKAIPCTSSPQLRVLEKNRRCPSRVPAASDRIVVSSRPPSEG